MPAAARKGPKPKASPGASRPIIRRTSATAKPSTVAANTTRGKAVQPSQAPNAASSLKSPRPRASLPVNARNAQRNRLVDLLTYRVTDRAEKVSVPTGGEDFEVA